MSDKWMTLAAAAATLNVHPRTIERRIAANKIETRRADDGQLQVLIQVSDDAQSGTEAFETVKELAQDQVSLATGSASALVKFAQADSERARGELDFVRQEAGRARRQAVGAWIAVAVMSGAICVAVGWTTHRITQADDDIRTMNQQAELVRQDAARLKQERDVALAEAQAARIAQAEAAGHLQAIADKPDIRPTTRPTNLFQRLATAFSEQ